jgi:hypothetical protein
MKKESLFGEIANNLMSPVKSWASNQLKPVIQNEVNSAMTSGENWLGNTVGKFAPLLTLPIMYGLMNSSSNQAPAPTVPQSNMISPNYIPRQAITPQGFNSQSVPYAGQFVSNYLTKSSSTTVGVILGSLHRKAVNSALDKVIPKKEDVDGSKPEASHIVATDEKTRKLLAHPKVKEYIDSLITT